MGGAGAAVRWTVMGAPPVEATDLARPRLQELLDVGGQGFESTACEDNVPRGPRQLPTVALADKHLVGPGVQRGTAAHPQYLDGTVQVLCRDAQRRQVGVVGHRWTESLAQGAWRGQRASDPPERRDLD
jgi:hypothetical protein